MKTVGMEAVLA